MRAVEKDADWNLMARDGKTVLATVKARALWDKICDAAWECGDPGLQFDTIINHMHTCPADGRINASNPCSEYMHLDDSACNLASLNLRKFQTQSGALNVPQYEQAIDVMILAMDILVDGAKYPTEKIGDNARKFRQLGLGYANLGAFLMNAGLPYDSDEGRYVAGLITAKLCGRAYRQSAFMAEYLGPFEGYQRNRGAMLDVIHSHTKNLCELHDGYDAATPDWYDYLYASARHDWDAAAKQGNAFGFRNSQVTVLAPTGTIAFMMDCDTTGIEPDTSLVKSKKLVGGGTMKIANQGVGAALSRLGYDLTAQARIVEYVQQRGSLVGSEVKDEHLPVFDTSFEEPIGKRALRPEAHVLMLAAAQPFISGAISKTCNLPENATREDVGNLYMLAWRKGLKAIALYRNGCKRSQPLSVAHAKEKETVAQTASTKLIEEQLQLIDQLKEQIADLQEQNQAHRRKLPDERQALTHKFKITTKEQEMKVYLTCGCYPDGSLGEIFIKSDKEGSTVSGLLDGIATLTSFALQHGVPLASLVQKFKRTAFEPHGWTGNPEIQYAASVMDYIFRYLELRFGNKQPIEVVSLPAPDFQAAINNIRAAAGPSKELLEHEAAKHANGHNGHANGNGVKALGEKVQRECPKCGGVMRRTGACVTCEDCGENTGCG
jgi:ribonucleoside-diphosphate reductase alpha chain